MIRCVFCNEKYQLGDLADFQDMGETYYIDKDTFICPDCLDDLNHHEAEEQLDILYGRRYIK